MRSLLRLSFILVAVSLNTAAATLELVDEPEARRMFQSSERVESYLLALSSYRKIGGDWGPDRQQRLSGELTRRTIELPAGSNATEAYRFYREQLQQLTLRELFTCEGRECGPSNSWANNHFRVIQLYGLDQHQRYGAYEVINSRQQRFYVSLYSVVRGNRRVYVQVDILKPDPGKESAPLASPDTLYRLLRNEGYFVVSGFSVSGAGEALTLALQPASLDNLVTLLNRQPDVQVALVGHDYAGDTLERQQRQSLAYAQHLKGELQKRGITAARLDVMGLGGLAPAGRGEGSARLEVVLLPSR